MTQTLAILIDAYRELNARKMFWISLVIALLVVSSFGILGIDDKGITLLWWTLPVEVINTTIITRKTFYVGLFVIIGLNLWLGWASTILALVSTASLLPDFVSSGSIECMLSKPIGRVRLFLTKYFAGLLFVVMQALVFTLAAIIVIGVRSNEWIWGLLLAVPVVTLFFSYLYSVSAFVGVLTRSTLAALLAALALWGVVIAVGFTEGIILMWRLNAEDPIPIMRSDIAALQVQIEKNENPPGLTDLKARLAKKETDLAEREDSAASAAKYHRYLWAAKTILPKTGETKDLLSRVVANDEDVKRFVEATEDNQKNQNGGAFQPTNRRVRKKVEAVMETRTAWWVLSTSIGFEAVVVGAAAWLFSKRDF